MKRLITTIIHLIYMIPSILCTQITDFRVNSFDSVFFWDNPSIATDDEGNFVITWVSSNIYIQRYNQNGDTLGPNVRVDNGSINKRYNRPDIAMDSEGFFVITWQEYQDIHSDIYAQCYNQNGDTIGINFKVNDIAKRYCIYPSIAMNNDSVFVITWVDYRIDRSVVYAQRFNKNGVKIGPNFKINNDPINRSYELDIAMDKDGNFGIIWDENSDRENYIYVRFYSGIGIPYGKSIKVSDGMRQNFDITVTGIGKFIIVWAGVDWREVYQADIYATQFDIFNRTFSSPFKINNNPVGCYSDMGGPWPPLIRIATDEAGNSLVVWEDTLGFSIFGQRFDYKNKKIGSSFPISNKVAMSQRRPDVKLCNGLIFSTWIDNRDHADGYNVWANVLDWDNPAVGIGKRNVSHKPHTYQLNQNYPNPFNPKTTIKYSVRAYGHTPQHVNLSIYNLLGQKIATLVDKQQAAGTYKVEWDATGLASGIYYYSIEAGDYREVKKMVLLK